ncbi:insulinase family protein [Aureivirga sp. CE67]|uniref:insulinase family protein n=1 Tax=Aureivirga sp. CE67 TaxID=1788983 RepID=UPI0018C98440|nr:pitrilysin family protein [Aureivirga sp. CE67]
MKTRILSIITILFVTLSMTAQDRNVQPKPGPAPTIKLEEPKEFTLKNGLKVLVVENHKLPRVSMSLSIDNGPLFEGDKAGVSSLLSSLLGSGSEATSKDKFNEEVDYLGARVNFSSSGASMSSLSKYFPEVLAMLADQALHPKFSQEEFDKQKEQIIEGLKSDAKSASAIAGKVRRAISYGKNHAYGEFTSEKTLENVTLADVEKLYNTYYKPNNAYIVVIGDVKYKKVKKLIKKYFKSWEKGEVPTTELPKVPAVAKTEIDFINLPNASQSEVSVINTVNLKVSDPDYFAVLLANKILGGGGEARLFLNLREAHGFTYGAYSRIGSDRDAESLFSASASVRNMVTDSAVVEFMKEIKKIRTEKVSEKELNNAKAAYTGNFVLAIERPSTVARYALNIITNDLPEDFYETYLQKINAVTVEDIQKAAQKYFNYDNTRIVIVGKALDVLPGLEKLPYPIKYFDTEANPAEKPELTMPVPAGVTAESVINNYVDAIGGKEKLMAVKTLSQKGKVKAEGAPFEIQATQKMAYPNKEYMELEAPGMGTLMKSVFNGEKGYMMQQGMKIDMTPDVLAQKKESKSMFPVMYLTEEGKDLSLDGIIPFNGSKAYKMVVTDKDGKKAEMLFDVNSGFLVQTSSTQEAMGQKITTTISFSDYKDFDGVKIPTKMGMISGPQKLSFEYTEIKLNEELSDKDFE